MADQAKPRCRRAHGLRSQRPCAPLSTASQIRTSPSSGAHSPCGYAVRTTVQTRWRACLPNGGGSLRARDAEYLAGRNFQHRAHTDAQSAHLRYGALAGTVFTNAKLTLYKIIKIVEVMWHSASPRLIELTCKVSHSTTFLLAPQDLLRRQRLEGLGDPFGTCMDRRDVVLQHQGRARGRRGLSQGQGLHHCGYRLVGL